MVRTFVRRTLPWLLLLVFTLIAGEFAIRAVLHARYAVPGKSLGRWEGDPVLGARMARNVYDHRMQTNDGGFRNVEDVIEPREDGALRVIAYGGSTTLCWNLGNEDAWPHRLEQKLRGETPALPHQVLNAGDINWSIGHVFARAREEVPRLRPDLVILYSGINEAVNAELLAASGEDMSDLVARGEYARFARNLPQASWFARNSFLYRAAQGRVVRPVARWIQDVRRDPLSGPPAEPRQPGRQWWGRLAERPDANVVDSLVPDPALFANYEHVLIDLIDLVNRNGGRLIFVVQAHAGESTALGRMTSYSRESAQTADERGALVIDAAAALPPDPTGLFYDSGVHFSAAGCEWFANLLYERISAAHAARDGEPEADRDQNVGDP